MFTTEISSVDLELPTSLPDHTQLPESDGSFVKNFQEHPQSILLTDSLWPVLEQLHPDEQYCIGQDSGIYWRLIEPPEKGAVAPDWFYVSNVPPTLEGKMRRSYVLWQEIVAPLIVLEFVSGNGSEERDTTPYAGKFWVYEQAIRVPFYGIYEVSKASIEVYHLIDGRYRLLAPNERQHYPISSLGVELGIWQGNYKSVNLPWLRWWDLQGNLLLTGEERAEQEKIRAEQEKMRAEEAELKLQQSELQLQQELQRSQRLAEQLRALGVEPD